MDPRISLVVPAYNEEAVLPRLLASVAAARAVYHRGLDAVEVVVADNGSTDTTAAVAAAHGARVVTVPERGIGAARNGGAAAAGGDVLAFVDADCTVHPDTFNAIDRTLDDAVVIGATGVRFDRTSLGMAVTRLIGNALGRLFRVDSGVVFCRRADFEAVGGYDASRMFLEDLQLMRDLKTLGRETGRRFARAKGVEAVTSSRKFDLHGEWHYLTGLFIKYPFWCLFAPDRLERWAEQYWYRERDAEPDS